MDQATAELKLHQLFAIVDKSLLATPLEWVALMKQAWGLQGYASNTTASRVLVNVIRESEDLCGYPDPELLARFAFEKRAHCMQALGREGSIVA